MQVLNLDRQKGVDLRSGLPNVCSWGTVGSVFDLHRCIIVVGHPVSCLDWLEVKHISYLGESVKN